MLIKAVAGLTLFMVTQLVGINQSPAEQIKVIAFSDINSSMGSTSYSSRVTNTMKKIIEKKPNLIIGVGDMVAGEDIRRRLPISTFRKMWQVFLNKILNPITGENLVFAPTPGNHDASGYSQLERERKEYIRFWSANPPSVDYVNRDHFPLFYSYMKDGVFFISLDDVTPFSLNQKAIQKKWIKEQLQSAQAKNAIARIVYGHIPIYAVLNKSKHSRNGRGKYYEVMSREQWKEDGNSLEQILIENQVSLAIFAHSHSYYAGVSYQKSNPQKALRILSMPCLGSGARYRHGSSNRSKTGFAEILIDRNSGEITYEMLTAAGDVLSKQTLPERIPQSNSKIRYVRDDLFSKKPSFFEN